LSNKRSLRKYLIASAIGIAIGIAVFAAKGGFDAADRVQVLYAFCDACFVPGVLLMGIGALVFCADDGVFDMLSYGTMKVINLVRSEKRRSSFPKTFYDYRQMKQAGRNGGFGYLLILGGVFIALAVMFLIIAEM